MPFYQTSNYPGKWGLFHCKFDHPPPQIWTCVKQKYVICLHWAESVIKSYCLMSHIMSWPTTGVFEKQGQHGHEHTRIMPQSSCEWFFIHFKLNFSCFSLNLITHSVSMFLRFLLSGLFEARVAEYLDSCPEPEPSSVNKFLKGLGRHRFTPAVHL